MSLTSSKVVLAVCRVVDRDPVGDVPSKGVKVIICLLSCECLNL